MFKNYASLLRINYTKLAIRKWDSSFMDHSGDETATLIAIGHAEGK